MKKRPFIARILDGSVRCPVCKAQLAKIYYGGYGMGIEVKCRCGRAVMIEAKARN